MLYSIYFPYTAAIDLASNVYHAALINSPQVLLTTQRAMPPHTKLIPIHVSLVINFPSATYSPSTVNRNANEFVIGTVRLNSVILSVGIVHKVRGHL